MTARDYNSKGPFFVLTITILFASFMVTSCAEVQAPTAQHTSVSSSNTVQVPRLLCLRRLLNLRCPRRPTNPSITAGTPCKVTKVSDSNTLYTSCLSMRVRLNWCRYTRNCSFKKTVECYGPEASAYTKQLLGQTVYLEADSTQGDADKYGRPLRYVYTADGTNWNMQLILEGS